MAPFYGTKMMKITKVMFLVYICSAFTYAASSTVAQGAVTTATTPATQSSSAATSVVTSKISTTSSSTPKTSVVTTPSSTPKTSVVATTTRTNSTTGSPSPRPTSPAPPACRGSSSQRMAVRIHGGNVNEVVRDVPFLFNHVYGNVSCYNGSDITGNSTGSVWVYYTVFVNHNMNALERSLLASLMYLRANASAGGNISVSGKTFTILQVVAYTRNNQEVNITGPCSLAVAERGCNTGTCQYSDTSVSCRCPSTHEGPLCERQRQNNVIIAVVTVVVVVVVGVVVGGILWRCVCGKSKKVQAS